MAIYFIQAGENGPIKIGQSDDPKTRLAQLQTANAAELKLLWVYHKKSYTEAKIHKRFSHERIRGEWFRPSRELLRFMYNNLYNEVILHPKNNSVDCSIIELSDGSTLLSCPKTIHVRILKTGEILSNKSVRIVKNVLNPEAIGE